MINLMNIVSKWILVLFSYLLVSHEANITIMIVAEFIITSLNGFSVYMYVLTMHSSVSRMKRM